MVESGGRGETRTDLLFFHGEKQLEGDEQPPLNFIFHDLIFRNLLPPTPHPPVRSEGPHGARVLPGGRAPPPLAAAAGSEGAAAAAGALPGNPGPSMAGHRRAAAGTTCEAGGDWREASYDWSRAPGSSVQKKMGFGVNLGV